MRILSVTDGAAGMYCGSCARDNALAVELLARGHDVTLIPVYTPTRTDEPNVSRNRVLFGGISVYLQQHASLFRTMPRFLDRIWDSPSVIRALAGRAVSNDPKLLGDLMISMLRGDEGVLRREFDKLIEWARDEPRPDIVNLPNSLLIALAAPLRSALNTPICCTLQGEELFLNGLEPPYRDQAIELIQQQVKHVDRFIAVSEYSAGFMSRFLNIPASKISVVPLGINTTGYEHRPTRHGLFTVGYFARVSPEKGLHVLADAYMRFHRRIGHASARLAAAGFLMKGCEPYLKNVKEMLDKAGLGPEFKFYGSVDRAGKLAFLGDLTVLSVPATYDEPKGLFLLEAMARGVPVVQPRRGAFTEIIEKTGGGLLTAPANPTALAEGLHAIFRERRFAEALSEQAFQGVREHYPIANSANRLLAVYDEVLKRPASASASVA